MPALVFAQSDPEASAGLRSCLQQQVLRPEHRNLGVADLYTLCEQQLAATGQPATTVESADGAGSKTAVADTITELNRFFRPYKDNYIVFGQARTADGSVPFSGEQLDTKFELGLTFNLFDEITNLTFLAPLGFGYSQRSWWNIAEDSAPFAEHNYNPEMFWRFDQPHRPLAGKFPFVDIIGVEHQSNGLQGSGSRSWDRAYIQKEFDLLPRLSINIKLWHVLGDEANNNDITDYLGQGEATIKFMPNERTRIRLRAMKGNNVEKYSYQLDISYRRPWVNSAFFISYYEGYGEALISYNRKSRSLRAGLYFPLEVLSR
ncbi:MAG: phospholipase A [Pseudohongiella sp.]